MDVPEFFSLFIEKLTANLKKPLPGETAHMMMEAFTAAYLGVRPNEQTRKSAVLMLLYPFKNEIYFTLILRNSYDGFHSGEIGFPGGRYEQADQDLIQTALREAQEEIGLRADEVKVLGTLTETYIAPSDFLVLPVVGYLPYRPDLLPDPREVQHIFEAKLNYFTDPKILGCAKIRIPGDVVLTPYYELNGYKTWGATAKMIRELLTVVHRDDP
jgi:NTP pyrophosphohydrolases including oxidative damage repair enzymes